MRKIKNKLILILIVILIIGRTTYVIHKYEFKYDTWKNTKIEVEIICVDSVSEESIRYIVKYNGDKFLLTLNETEKIYSYGDVLEIVSSNYETILAGNPYEFNYKRYLNSRQIVSSIYSYKVISVKENRKTLLSLVFLIREYISNKLDEAMTDENSNILKSLMYGEDTYLSEEVYNKFSNIGLGHFLCVSGTHIIYLLISFKSITKLKNSKFLESLILIYFYFISLFNLSLLRALCMKFVELFDKNTTFYRKYCVALYIVICINPYYIFNIGIILSFLSILSIHIFNPLIKSYLKKYVKKTNLISDYIIESIAITTSVQILIFPVQIYYFGSLALISVVANIVVGLTLSLLLRVIFLLFLSIFIPIISDILIYICSLIIDILMYQVNFFNDINFLNLTFPKPSFFVFVIYYLNIFILLNYKKIILISWKYRKILKKLAKIICSLCCISLIFWYIKIMYFESYVIFFNVGQGNMALIHNYRGNIIVDIGSTVENNAANVMLNYLEGKNITKIDMILLTHMHSDHINGIENLVASGIEVGAIGYSIPCEDSDEYLELLTLMNKYNISKFILTEGDTILIGNVKIDILTPPISYYIEDDDMLNANSTAYLIEFNGLNILFMGDSTKKTEKYILDKYINFKYGQSSKILEISSKLQNLSIYQVSHHGSSTSTYEPFISSISRCSAIISSKKSVYGHPSDSVVEILKKYNFNILITENLGAIKF